MNNEGEYLEDEDWFGAIEEEGHEVVKTEHIGGTVHIGDIDFEELYGQGEHTVFEPLDTDFAPVSGHEEVMEEEEFVYEEEEEGGDGFVEEDYNDYDDEMFVEFETFDDEAFEKMLELQKDLSPQEFEKAVEIETATEKAAAMHTAGDAAVMHTTEEAATGDFEENTLSAKATHYTDGEKSYEVNEFEDAWLDHEEHALMVPYDEEEVIASGAGVLGVEH